MARPMCMSEDGNQAVFVGTMLETGDGFTLCDECLAMWAIAMTSTMTGVDPTPFIAALSEPETEAQETEPGAEPQTPDPTSEGGSPESSDPPSEATAGGLASPAPGTPTVSPGDANTRRPGTVKAA